MVCFCEVLFCRPRAALENGFHTDGGQDVGEVRWNPKAKILGRDTGIGEVHVILKQPLIPHHPFVETDVHTEILSLGPGIVAMGSC